MVERERKQPQQQNLADTQKGYLKRWGTCLMKHNGENIFGISTVYTMISSASAGYFLADGNGKAALTGGVVSALCTGFNVVEGRKLVKSYFKLLHEHESLKRQNEDIKSSNEKPE